jgi:hypothetical protein
VPRIAGIDGDARHTADHVDPVAAVGLSVRDMVGPDRLPRRRGRGGSRRRSRPRAPRRHAPRARAGELCRRSRDRCGEGLCGGSRAALSRRRCKRDRRLGRTGAPREHERR